MPPLIYLARHAETIFNRDARMQGNAAHTPLTRDGIAQAEAMGTALARHFGTKPDLAIWASPTGRTLQTASIIAEHLGLYYFDITTDARLAEINVGAWVGQRYHDIVKAHGPIVCPERRLFSQRPPGGEWYPDMAARLKAWLTALPDDRPVLAISHGLTSRVLRGHLVGGTPFEPGCVPIAPEAPQGTVFRIAGSVESMLHVGTGSTGGHRQGF